MSTAQLKTPTVSTARSSVTNNSTSASTLNRSPSRMAKPAATTGKSAVSTNSSTGELNRARSVRTAAPVSARAAVRKPAETDTAMDELRAEMQAKLDELQTQLLESQAAFAESQKHASLLQAKFDEAFKEQGILEENVHEQSERVEELENARREIEREKRELEQIYESERAASMREREESQTKQGEMEATVLRLKESLAQRDARSSLLPDDRPSPLRAASFRSSSSAELDGPGQFAPPASVQRSDSRNSSKLVMQKDKIIEGLRMELAEAQIRIVELENMGGGQMQQVQRQLYEVKIQNARLMEENESFQLLLSEKTLNGDFAQSDLLNPHSSSPTSRSPSLPNNLGGASLADELASSEDTEEHESSRKQQSEVNSLKDQNKALTLYINNIISRLLQYDQFEHILDKTPELMAGPHAGMRTQAPPEKDLPPPPPPKDAEPTGFLQRAKSVMGAAARPIRPLSFAQPSAYQEPRLTENPETAPSIPLGRSGSVRTGHNTHRRANSDWNAASVVTNMYRGPSPNLQGPISPGLTSPTRTTFFSQPQPAGGQRISSNINVTAAESESKKENIQQRDSKLSNRNSMISHRTSMTSTAGFTTSDALDSNESGLSLSEQSNPSSPPRSIASSNEKDSRIGGGAVMMGSKMRPLRLVQEAAKDEDYAKKQAANRGSWFGWMNGQKPGAVAGGKPEGSGI